MTESHPLYGAHLRAERGDIHLSEADHLIRLFSEACKDHIVTHEDGSILKLNGWPVIPFMLPIVISDAIHNMRTALDYIVYEMARHDSSGQVQEGTQFPIEDCKADPPVNPKRGFDARRKTYLKGLTDAHVAMIEDVQPYKGINWTKNLRSISNPDKHRKLTALGSLGRSVTISVHPIKTGRFGPSTFKDGNNLDFTSRYDVKMDAHNAIAIAGTNPDETSLIRQLRDIEMEVFRLIGKFESEF